MTEADDYTVVSCSSCGEHIRRPLGTTGIPPHFCNNTIKVESEPKEESIQTKLKDNDFIKGKMKWVGRKITR